MESEKLWLAGMEAKKNNVALIAYLIKALPSMYFAFERNKNNNNNKKIKEEVIMCVV